MQTPTIYVKKVPIEKDGRKYTLCEPDEDISEEKNQRDYDEFFASETPTKTSKK